MAKKNQPELISNLSVDCVIFGFDLKTLNVLLIDRGKPIARGKQFLALPGNLIYKNEDLDQAANRVLRELTGLSEIYMEQVGAFGGINRVSKESDRIWLKAMRDDPDTRVITIGYYSLVNMADYSPQPSSYVASAKWVPVKQIKELAFDHKKILDASLNKLKEKLRTKPIGFKLLSEKFTLSQLQCLYEAILDRPLDKRNFRRKILKLNILTRLQEKQKGVAHKPSHLFEFNEVNYNSLVETGFENFDF